jgi:glutamyl-tRNA synthetase
MMIRLMDFCNVVLEDGVWKYHSKAYEDFKTFAAPKKIIHWVVKDTVPVEVLMPDATKCTGNGESSLAQAKVGDVIQFERFGFCRLDSIENGTYKFWFGHK